VGWAPGSERLRRKSTRRLDEYGGSRHSFLDAKSVGVYLQIEVVALSLRVPPILAWLINLYINLMARLHARITARSDKIRYGRVGDDTPGIVLVVGYRPRPSGCLALSTGCAFIRSCAVPGR
jgi:hypothetical protein